MGAYPTQVREVINKFALSKNVDLQQRSFELTNLEKDMTLMEEALPLDASCEVLEVDESLSFLDHFVTEQLGRGAKKYVPQSQRFFASPLVPAHGENSQDIIRWSSPLSDCSSVFIPVEEHKKAIRFEAYDRPKLVTETTSVPSFVPASVAEVSRHDNLIADLPTPEMNAYDAGKPATDVKKKWGKTGYLGKTQDQPQSASAYPSKQDGVERPSTLS